MNYKIIAFIISSLLGSGVFVIPGLLIPNGIIGFIVFFLISIIFLLFGFYLCSIKSSLQEFLTEKFGKHISSGLMWSYWISATIGTTMVIIEFISYMGLNQSPFSLYYKIGFVLFFTFINIFNFKINNKINTINIFIILLLLIIIPGICMIKGESIIPKIGIMGKSGIGETIKSSIASVLWLFVGIESGAIISEEKTYKKEVLLGIGIVIFIYFINIYGISLINTSFSLTSYSDSMFLLFGSSGRFLLNFIISFVLLNAINTWVIICAQSISDLLKTPNKQKDCTKKYTIGFCAKKYTIGFCAKKYTIGLIMGCIFMCIILFISHKTSDLETFNNLLSCAVNSGILFYVFILYGLYKSNKSKIDILILLIIFFLIFVSGNILIPVGIMTIIFFTNYLFRTKS